MGALHRSAKRLMTIAAVVVLGGCSPATSQTTSQAVGQATGTSPVPSAQPTIPKVVGVPPTAAPAARAFPNDVPLVAGDYVLSGNAEYGVPPLEIAFAVPSDRWRSWGHGLLTNESDVLAIVGIAFHAVTNVYADACRWETGGTRDPAVGPAVDDLAAALAQVPHTHASAPVDVELAGYPGRYTELTIDDDLKFAECDQGQVHIWVSPEGWSRYYQGPGQIERFWVLDVDGTRLVIEGSLFPGASTANRDELQQILDSISVAQ